MQLVSILCDCGNNTESVQYIVYFSDTVYRCLDSKGFTRTGRGYFPQDLYFFFSSFPFMYIPILKHRKIGEGVKLWRVSSVLMFGLTDTMFL